MRGKAGALRALRKYRVVRRYDRSAFMVRPFGLQSNLLVVEKPDHMAESDFREFVAALEILTEPA